jgi:hypothetical protein
MQAQTKELEFELWECPPLRAWVSHARCAANRRWASGAEGTRKGAGLDDEHSYALRLRECVTCRGVAWWAKETGRGPRSLSSAALVAEHARNEAQRRRLSAGGMDPTVG